MTLKLAISILDRSVSAKHLEWIGIIDFELAVDVGMVVVKNRENMVSNWQEAIYINNSYSWKP